VEETSVDTSRWVGQSAEEPPVDTECQSKIMMGGWISGRDICGHCSYRLNLSKFALDFQHVFRYY